MDAEWIPPTNKHEPGPIFRDNSKLLWMKCKHDKINGQYSPIQNECGSLFAITYNNTIKKCYSQQQQQQQQMN